MKRLLWRRRSPAVAGKVVALASIKATAESLSPFASGGLRQEVDLPASADRCRSRPENSCGETPTLTTRPPAFPLPSERLEARFQVQVSGRCNANIPSSVKWQELAAIQHPHSLEAPAKSCHAHTIAEFPSSLSRGIAPWSRASLGAFDMGVPVRRRPSPFGVIQQRSMFIQTQSTPNPASLMFLPGSVVLPPGDTAEFASARAALSSPLAISLFRIDGVSRVFLGSEFITVTKSDDASWDVLKPEIFAAIMDFYASGKPVVDPSAVVDTTTGEEDSEIVMMIKELLETRIRPAVQEDGGDIDFHSFNEETGLVVLRMKGACSGCPSSSLTLKSGVENMLMHYIPEVTSVEQLMEDEVAPGDDPAEALPTSAT